MFLSLKKVSPCLLVTILFVYFSVSSQANEEDSGSSISDMITEEMSAAVTELRLLASNVRGDKIDRKIHSRHLTNRWAELRTNGLSDRTVLNRTSVREDSFTRYTFPMSSDMTVDEISAIEHSSHSRLGGYVRVDNTIYPDSTPNRKSHESDYSGYSLTLGGDYLFREHYLFGLTLGLPFNQPLKESSETEIDGMVASGYFSYLRDAWYVDFTASYAVMDTDIERQVSLYADSVINNANNADSDIWVFTLGTGYVFYYKYLNIALESSLQYTLSDTDRYAERISLSNSNYLIANIDNVDALESTMLITGMSLSHPLRTPFGVFQPYAKGYIHYDLASGNEHVISQLKSNHSGSILPIIVESDDNVYGRLHLGISGALSQDWYGYAEASRLLWHDDLSAYTISVGVSIALD
ncbi:autotransporter domain-containing protein [Photobacterium nomapromontoriensis]|uniref:autotransporter domain-containing protein n=1 Tax=Photobacterium nomapromontoriensis TaxID=2910237 RepID=UPI003D0E8A0A